MKKYLIKLALTMFAFMATTLYADGISVFDKPLKKEYPFSWGGTYKKIYQPGEFVDSFSASCDIGREIKDGSNNWTIKLIEETKLELRTLATVYGMSEGLVDRSRVDAMGFIVVTKNDHDFLIAESAHNSGFPNSLLGGFLSWETEKADISITAKILNGGDLVADVNLFSGNGNLFLSDIEPEFFKLSNCKNKEFLEANYLRRRASEYFAGFILT